MMMGAYGAGDPRILGSTPFTCDLCMATGPSAAPCPFHAEKSWAEWLTDALREWVWTIQWALRRGCGGEAGAVVGQAAQVGLDTRPPAASARGRRASR